MNPLPYRIKMWIRGMVPPSMIRWYHWLMARFAAWWFGYPSRSMLVIAVTGTNGKSTTVNMIGRILEEAGERVGWTSTANYKVAEIEWLNDTKMTMVGRFSTQRLLASMRKSHCTAAVIEMSSEGLAQFRHIGIDVDIAVFTNFTPEHLESHGGLLQYQTAKEQLFRHVHSGAQKTIHGRSIPKAIVSNLDDAVGVSMFRFAAKNKIGYCLIDSRSDAPPPSPPGVTRLAGVRMGRSITGSVFDFDGCIIRLGIPGDFNVSNALAAIAATRVLAIPLATVQSALAAFSHMPGRVEWINAGQSFKVMVDYAPEPASLAAVYQFLAIVPHRRLIHVFGSAGGGRDASRRPILGKMAAEHADVVIVTNEDPYDEDPSQIINQVAAGTALAQRSVMKQLHIVVDRREAIMMAVTSAEEDDIVLVTGKACEQAICVANGQKIPWDDRTVVREAIATRLKKI